MIHTLHRTSKIEIGASKNLCQNMFHFDIRGSIREIASNAAYCESKKFIMNFLNSCITFSQHSALWSVMSWMDSPPTSEKVFCYLHLIFVRSLSKVKKGKSDYMFQLESLSTCCNDKISPEKKMSIVSINDWV